VAENAGTTTITVNRTGGTLGAVTIHYATSDGTAHAGVNYIATSGDLHFADGDTSKSFTITVLDDHRYIGNQTVNITLTAPTGGAILGSPGSAVLTITETDPKHTPGDFNGDGKTDIGVFGPYGPNGIGRIAVLESGGGVINMPFGGALDTPISGDFDGDGKTDIGVYGPYGPNGANRFAILLSGGGAIVQTMGGPLDKPVIGDFDGDGKADLGVYGPYGPNGANRLLVQLSGGGTINMTIGGPLDTFVPGDFDGDGKTDIAVYGPYGPNGLNRLAVLYSSGGGFVQTIGGPLDQPVVGDFNGDGKTDVGVYGPYGPGGLNRLAVLLSGGGAIVQTFGGPLDRFVAGDFDGDGKTDIGVYGPYGPNGVGRLAVLESGGGAFSMAFGGPKDIPLPPPIVTPFSSGQSAARSSFPGSRARSAAGQPTLAAFGASLSVGDQPQNQLPQNPAAALSTITPDLFRTPAISQDLAPAPKRHKFLFAHDLALEDILTSES
jgi:hypothetical protein